VYAPLFTVPAVPMTPIRPVRVAFAAARAPGSITPIAGTGAALRSSSRLCAVAVLHATTTIFTSRPSRNARISLL
jgi:hypothetical protein